MHQAVLIQEKAKEEERRKPAAPKLLSSEIASAKKLSQASGEDFSDKSDELKEKILSRRADGEEDEEALDLGASAFSGGIIFLPG